MRVAHSLGMGLGEYMESHTHLEHLMWVEWLNEELNNPSQISYYLMVIITEIRRMFAKNPSAIKFESAKLKFDFKAKNFESSLSDEERRSRAAAISKARWLGLMTMPVKNEAF